ncbi:MAG: serine hydrolase domain-containing protein [Propionicimonas sp.]|uniref:serine hydrolase domain-containing protein n=1 Tax=Propionicimonas sp. TaxID=1955623 RepID=UPI003D11DE04
MRADEAALTRAIAENAFSGVVAIDQPAESPYRRAVGFAHRALGVPNNPRTRFALASGGKTFTALAVLRLVQEGRLSLDDPVRPLLGDDLPLVDDAVTVSHLLEHTSGIGDYLDESAEGEPDDYVLTQPVHTLAETAGFLPELTGHPQVSTPGERFAYNNGGYLVLALVAERATGRGYHELVLSEVVERAGLACTAFLRSDDLPGDAALGYLDPGGNRTNLLHLPVRGNGDGGIWSTVDDLHRFWLALDDGRIVDPPLVGLMTTPRHDVPEEGLRHGMGVWLLPSAAVWLMEGCDAGVSMRSIHDPATRTTATVLGNTTFGAWPVAELLLQQFG